MRVLSLTAQKPTSTGSGIYLVEVMKALSQLDVEQAIVYGKMPNDEVVDIVRPSRQYTIEFKSDTLPFPICGMSDIMPYEATRYCDLSPSMTAQFKDAYRKTITRAIRDFKPDLFICHHLYLATSIANCVAKEISPKTKVVAICHGTDIRQMKNHNLKRDFIRQQISSLDRVFALHDEQVVEIVENYGVDRGKINVLGSGYNSSVFKDNPSIKREKNSVLFVGKVCKAKGVESLIRSFKEFEGRLNSATLTIVGGHSDEGEYEEILSCAQSTSNNIDFTGVLSLDGLVKGYQRSHIFVLPSFFEGLPLVSLEACACGCVCVMTALPGVREWYTKNAPNAPIIFVDAPKMDTIDKPCAKSLPAFEARLGQALIDANDMIGNPSSVKHLSWRELAKKLLAYCCD